MNQRVDTICILAGGSGTRLWPASNSHRPKQFIPVQGEKSLLQLTIERALQISRGEIFIVTLDEQLESLAAECGKLEQGLERVKLVAEPAPRNTAPAIAAAAVILRNQGRGGETMAVLPSDHLITPREAFAADMTSAAALARQGYLVTFGVKPDRPETGYGYIEAGGQILAADDADDAGVAEGGEKARGAGEAKGFSVTSFREKPDLSRAEQFYRDPAFYWNSGMFCFRADRYLEELHKGRPDIARLFDTITIAEPSETVEGMELYFRDREVQDAYAKSPKDSIDYAVMEKCSRVAMVPATFTWNDIGSWDELSRVLPDDLEGAPGNVTGSAPGNVTGSAPGSNPGSIPGNTAQTTAIALESKGCYVHSDLPVALCGVEELMVVQKNGVLLICKRGRGQLVKDAVNRFREIGREELL